MAPTKTILFVDNDPDFLNTRSRFLEIAGFTVLKAGTLADGEKYLREVWSPLAILDVRLIDDDDEKDLSGLALAKMESSRPIKKIILTGWPTFDLVRELLRIQNSGAPLAVDFLSKEEGPEALVEAVGLAFQQHVQINWDLEIDWRANPSYSLVSLIEPGMELEQLLNRAVEIEDLFRRLFYEKNQIRIDRLLWQRDGRLALTVFAYAEGKAPESMIVVCGPNPRIAEETRRYREFAPRAAGEFSTTPGLTATTVHLAAIGYTLAGADLENVQALADLYRAGLEKPLQAALETLFQKIFSAWHQEKPIPEGMKSLNEIYRERFGLDHWRMSESGFEERIRAIVAQASALGSKIDRNAGKLILRSNDHVYAYPDPTPVIYQSSNLDSPILLMHTPGTHTGENILTDANGRTWLTDFADAGLAPHSWNFVSIEAAIRFDWGEIFKLPWLHVMEERLIDGNFSKLDLSDLEAQPRKQLRAIQIIRRMASQALVPDPLQYHYGILYQAAGRIAAFNPKSKLTPPEIGRLIHALLSAAMISGRVGQKNPVAGTNPAPVHKGIRIDKPNYAVWIDGTRVPLRGQSYELLNYFFDRADQLCSRREIVELVFQQKYDETDESQLGRLNTAIRRLREKIEVDPDHPRYLITEPGGGYRLLSRGKE
jgi:DNA-binding response OmpR family regulator